jgi:cytochrome b
MTTSSDPRLPSHAIDRQGPGSAGALRRTRIWDLPTRLFHWLLALATIGLIVTGRSGIMEWHFRLGYAVLALLLFRLAWGFMGGRWSRFASFLRGPRALAAYLRGRAHPDHLVGHTPLGALSVLAMLAILGLQVVTGLMADDEIAAAGPLSHWVSGAVAGWSTTWHAERGQWVVMGLIGLHVLAIAYYVLVRRHRLVMPMVSGDKQLAPGTAALASRDDARSRLSALAVFALCAAAAAGIASLRP